MSGVFDSIQAKQGLTAKNLSQMSHISEKGMPASENARLEAKAKSKMEVRVRNLERVHAYLLKLQARLVTIPTLDKSSGLSILGRALSSIDRLTAQKSCPVGVATPMRKLRNELVSIRELVSSKNPKSIKASYLTSKQISSALEDVTGLLDRAKTRLTAADDIVNVRNDYDSAFRQAELIIKKNSESVRRLDSINNRPFTLVRVPIVVIAEPGLSVEKLRKLGIGADDIAGYTLLRDQMVLGVSKKAFAENKKRGKRDIQGFVEELLVMLKKQTKKNLVLVDKNSSHAKDALWFWVADEKDINRFFNSAKGRLNIKRWGFGMNT